MASTSETGHAKNISNFQVLIEACDSYGNKYQPSENELVLAALNAQYTTCDAAQKAMKNPLAAYGQAVGERETLFAGFDPLITRVINRFELSKAPDNVRKSAKTLADKIRGTNRKRKSPAPEGEAPADDTHSTSQRSYVMMADNFDTLISILAAEPSYNPAEDDLKVTTLKALHTNMGSLDANVGTAFESLRSVRTARDLMLYAEGTGLVDVALQVKKYVKSVFGASSTNFKKVSGLKFSRPNKRKTPKA